MRSETGRKTSLVFGILSLVVAIFLPLVGVILGIIGLNVTREKGHEDRDLILNWLGIGLSIVAWAIYFISYLGL